MVNESTTAAIAISVTGSVLSFVIYLAPYIGIRAAQKLKSNKSLPDKVYISTLLNSVFWSLYGVKQSNFVITYLNAVGAVIEMVYLFMFHRLHDTPQKRAWWRAIVFYLLPTIIIIVPTALWMPTEVCGYFAIVWNFFLFISPLQNVARAFRTKDASLVPLPISAACFAAACAWVAYSFVIEDKFVFIPNAWGIAQGIAQLSIIAYITSAAKKIREAETHAELKTPVTGCDVEAAKPTECQSVSVIELNLSSPNEHKDSLIENAA